MLSELWRRALATHPAPEPTVSAILAAAALALVLVAWPLVRLFMTVCHEAGHAVVALLVGRKLSGIRLHSDTSGLTVSRGRPSGPGMVATLFAGYPAASVLGLGAAWLAGAGYAVGLLWLLVVLLALMLLKLRNIYGALVVLATGALVAVFSWYATPTVAGWLATGLAVGGAASGGRVVVRPVARLGRGPAGRPHPRPARPVDAALAGAHRRRAAARCVLAAAGPAGGVNRKGTVPVNPVNRNGDGSSPVQRWRATRFTNTSSMDGSTSATTVSGWPRWTRRSRRAALVSGELAGTTACKDAPDR